MRPSGPGSGAPRAERVRKGAEGRDWVDALGAGGLREMLEAFRDGGPRKRDGGGGR